MHASGKPEDRPSRTPPANPFQVATDTWDVSRRYAIYRGNTLIGTSNLEYPVAFGSRVAGRFYATRAFADVADVFQRYALAVLRDDRELLREFVRIRDSVNLEVWEAGVRLNARVDLISEWDATTRIIHVSTADSRFWSWRRLH